MLMCVFGGGCGFFSVRHLECEATFQYSETWYLRPYLIHWDLIFTAIHRCPCSQYSDTSYVRPVWPYITIQWNLIWTATVNKYITILTDPTRFTHSIGYRTTVKVRLHWHRNRYRFRWKWVLIHRQHYINAYLFRIHNRISFSVNGPLRLITCCNRDSM